MMATSVFLMIVWFLVVWFYKGEPPPSLDPPIDINAEFGKQYFTPPEVLQKEEALSRLSTISKDSVPADSVVIEVNPKS